VQLVPDDADMDAQFQRTLAVAAAGGCDVGEAVATVERVKPGDYDSWWDEWSATAMVAEKAGDDDVAGGHAESARLAYLRASEYWRQAWFFLRHDLDDPRLQDGWRHHRATFRSSMELSNVDVITEEIPFDGASMTAYLFRVGDLDAGEEPHPTVIAPCGYDSTAEAGWLATGAAALAHGYHCFVFEGPGQGGMLYEHRRPLRPDFEVPFGTAFQWLLGQAGVDPDRIALVGRSFAGYLAPRAAAFEPRIAALVCDPGQYDYATRMRGMFPGEQFQQLVDADPKVDDELDALLDGPRNVEWYGARMATLGATRVGDFLRRQMACNLEGLVSRITCPTLLTEGEGDFAAQTDALYGQLAGDKQVKRFTIAEGAGGHCEGLGATLWSTFVFDWLDDVLGARSEGATT
jgi:hypothetical protein